MAAVIRKFIDEKMEIPEDAWTNNPILRPWPHDPDWKKPRRRRHQPRSLTVMGVSKDVIKVKANGVDAPPLPR